MGKTGKCDPRVYTTRTGGDIEWDNLVGKWWFLTKLSTHLPRIPAILLLCIFPAGGASEEEDLSLITPEILRSPYHPTGAMSHTPLLTQGEAG